MANAERHTTTQQHFAEPLERPHELTPCQEESAHGTIIVAPTTFNTLNKWAIGITDTLAVGILCEHTGLGTPIVTIPCVPSESLARHSAFCKSMNALREEGVQLLYEPEKYSPMNNIPWKVTLRILDNVLTQQEKEGVT